MVDELLDKELVKYEESFVEVNNEWKVFEIF